MERSYQEAVEKLEATIRDDMKIDPSPLDSFVPCIDDVEEGHTQKEKERIRTAPSEDCEDLRRPGRQAGPLPPRVQALRLRLCAAGVHGL